MAILTAAAVEDDAIASQGGKKGRRLTHVAEIFSVFLHAFLCTRVTREASASRVSEEAVAPPQLFL